MYGRFFQQVINMVNAWFFIEWFSLTLCLTHFQESNHTNERRLLPPCQTMNSFNVYKINWIVLLSLRDWLTNAPAADKTWIIIGDSLVPRIHSYHIRVSQTFRSSYHINTKIKNVHIFHDMDVKVKSIKLNDNQHKSQIICFSRQLLTVKQTAWISDNPTKIIGNLCQKHVEFV